jgi:glycosyltransferase involved in cell wall biosynthesis
VTRKVDISLLITFHREGVLAHSTLNSIERCRAMAEAAGHSCEYVLVFDNADQETLDVVGAHRASRHRVTALTVDYRDAGLSRNEGIAAAEGTYVATLDGDDYYSGNWIERAVYYAGEYGAKVVLHPEFVVTFGAHAAYCWQVDQRGRYFDVAGLLMSNFWTSWTFAARQLYLDNPYQRTDAVQTGFGYEDWHWNCDTVARGIEHRLAWGTVGFYRRKPTSRVQLEVAEGAIIPPTALFAIGNAKRLAS